MAKMEPAPIAYFEGKYVPIEQANISIMTHAFNYGTGLFEGIRGYYVAGEDNVLVFKLQEHIDRMVRNCNVLCMDIPETPAQLGEICMEVARRSGFKEGVYIRPLVYKCECSLGPKLRGIESAFCCYAIKLGDYVDIKSGLRCCVTSWRRVADNAMPTRVKSTGSYLNSALAATEAKQAGFDEAIFLREDGTVAEGSAMNLFMIHQGKLVTPPPNSDILVGITRNTVIELAKEELGLEVIERPIARTELYVCDELFFCGTGAQVAPVSSVDQRPIGNGTPGPISTKLQQVYFDVVMGKVPKYRKWCTPVY